MNSSKQILRRGTPLLLLALLLLPVQTTAAGKKQPSHVPGKVELTAWDTAEGEERLERSEYKKDFFPLANHFRGQPNGVVCGPTTASIVLNALRLRKGGDSLPRTDFPAKLRRNIPKQWDPSFARYTPENFFTKEMQKVKTRAQVFGEPIDGKKDFGFQLRQLHDAFIAHGVKSELRVVDDTFDEGTARREMKENLARSGDFVVVNYARKTLGQKGGAHTSPVGAYDSRNDSCLVMDVNPNKADWVWVRTADLVAAMRTHDTVENRGYLLISESAETAKQ